MVEHTDHQRITVAGWNYRTNSSGWVIYRNPQTRQWQTHSEAIFIIEAQAGPSRTSLDSEVGAEGPGGWLPESSGS
jgi:hypothetical protein